MAVKPETVFVEIVKKGLDDWRGTKFVCVLVTLEDHNNNQLSKSLSLRG